MRRQKHTHAIGFPDSLRRYGTFASFIWKLIVFDQSLVEIVRRKGWWRVKTRLSVKVDEAYIVDGANLRVVEARDVLHALWLCDVANKERVQTVLGW